MIKIRLSLLVAAAAAGSMLLGACGNGEEGSGEGTKLLLLSQQTPFTAPSYMALELGYYEEAGLDVEIRAFPTGTTALEAWNSGIGDVIFSGAQPALLHFGSSAGRDYRMIQMATRSPEDLIIMARTEIAQPSDLAGKVIATRVGSTSEWWLERYLSHHGLSVDDVQIINLDSQQMAPAIDKGDIDAFALYQPVGWQAEEVAGDKIHQLANATDVPNVSDLTVYGARSSKIEEDPDVMKAFVEATQRGAEHVTANLDAVGTHFSREFGAEAEQTIETIKFFDFNPSFDDEAVGSMEDLVTWSVEHGLLDEPVSLDEVLWRGAADN